MCFQFDLPRECGAGTNDRPNSVAATTSYAFKPHELSGILHQRGRKRGIVALSRLPLTPDLPILSHTIYEAPDVTEEEAIAVAKQRIDRLLWD